MAGPEDSLSLEVTGDPVQTHDQVFFVRLQAEAARGPDQKVAGLTYRSLGILACGNKMKTSEKGRPGALGRALWRPCHLTLSAPDGSPGSQRPGDGR